jgi:SAM-dependent methyltransferase
MIYESAKTYTDRAGKAMYIADKYAPILNHRVLDVGCDQRFLARWLPVGSEYVGIDLAPPADICLNLETQPIPFTAQSFDTVVCTDVLEHLDRIHDVFDQLCRIAKSHLIVSLPNPARQFVMSLRAGTVGRQKFYGLPLDPPGDRHRWFFDAEEAGLFVRSRAARNGFEIEHLHHEDSWVSTVLSSKGEILNDSHALKDGTLWAVLRRSTANGELRQ